MVLFDIGRQIKFLVKLIIMETRRLDHTWLFFQSLLRKFSGESKNLIFQKYSQKVHYFYYQMEI